jgi:hypothetical protein
VAYIQFNYLARVFDAVFVTKAIALQYVLNVGNVTAQIREFVPISKCLTVVGCVLASSTTITLRLYQEYRCMLWVI